MSSSRQRPTTRRTARFCGPFAAAIALGAIAAAPAQATIVGDSLEADENITVFHNIDFIGAFATGAVGDSTTISVIRNGVTIGTTTGPIADLDDDPLVVDPALEANHGVEGTAGPGDCWVGHTPDVRPRDLIRVRNNVSGDVDEVLVDEIEFVGDPEMLPNGDIIQRGVARRADGTPIPTAALDSNGFLDTSKFRGPAHDVQPWADQPGGFINVYHPPYNMIGDGRNSIYPLMEQRRDSLLFNGGHEAGFGHVAPLPPEAMLLDGNADEPTAGIGCEASVPQADRVTSAAPGVVNAATGDLVVNGTRQTSTAAGPGAGDVAVTVTDSVGNATAAKGATENGTNWTVSITAAERAAATPAPLADGPLTVSATYDHGGTPLTGKTLKVDKDTLAPVASASLASGTYTGEQELSLSSSEEGVIEYSVDEGATWFEYTGPLGLDLGAHAIDVRATDAAGNVSAVVLLDYLINAAPVQQQSPASPAAAAAAPAVAPPVLNQVAAPSLRLVVSSYRLASRTSLRTARTRGVEVAYNVPAGADQVTFAVYRVGAQAAARKAVVKKSVRVNGASRRVIRIRSAKFKAGRYSLEITPSQGGKKGATSKRRFRITN